MHVLRYLSLMELEEVDFTLDPYALVLAVVSTNEIALELKWKAQATIEGTDFLAHAQIASQALANRRVRGGHGGGSGMAISLAHEANKLARTYRRVQWKALPNGKVELDSKPTFLTEADVFNDDGSDQ